MEPFSISINVNRREGRQDKIELMCRDFLCLRGGDGDIDQFRRRLAASEGSGLRLFNRAPSLTRKPFVIRKKRIARRGGGWLGSPLFGGECRIRKASTEIPGEKTARLDLHLAMNPTRFLVHQWPCDGAPRQLGNLLKHALPYGTQTEYSFDLAPDNRTPSDNWLPNRPLFQANASGSGWQNVLRSYLKGTLGALDAEFRSVMRLCDLQAAEVPPRAYTLKRVETYWEFSSPDPIKLVYDLRPLVAAYGEREIELRHYDRIRRRDALAKHHNSPVLSVMIRGGVSVVIYAKTNQRVRFEVRHVLGKLNCSLAGRQNTVGGEREVKTVLNRFRDDAANVINSLFTHMRGQRSHVASEATPLQFLAAFARATRRASRARGILSMLVYLGRVVNDDSIRPEILALRNAGILECVLRNNRRAHKVTPKYRKAVELLRKADASLFGVRDRNRAG